MRKLLTVLSILAVLVAAGCSSGSGTKESSNNAQQTNNQSTPTPKDTENSESSGLKTFKPIANAKDLAAVITTDKGVIAFSFYPDKAPNTIANFITLARDGFYDGTSFHRVVQNFVIQGGDPNTKTGTGQAGAGGPGYNIKAEFNDMPHLDGTVAMARSDNVDSAGSQFYICLGAQPNLDGNYTVFGQVFKGMDVIYKITEGDVMKSVKIVPKSEVK